MARTATGIDVGTSTAKLLRGEVKGNSFVVHDFVVGSNPDGTVASGWAALGDAGKPKAARVGLTGRELNVRYTRVPRVPDWQLRKLMRFEAEEVGGQSEAAVASDFNVLPEIPEIEGEDVVLLAMARESMLDEHERGLKALGGVLDAYTPNSIALYNAFLHYGVVMEDTVLVANIGHDNVDVIVMRGTDLLFARNLTGGSRLFDDALVQRFGISAERAEEFKVEEGSIDPAAEFADADAEKASRAMMGPAGQILSLLQSTVVFCKSQVKLSTLKLDRVFLCGGGAALDGLTQYLTKGLGVPVELFDPFIVVDVSKLDAEAAQSLEDHRLEAVVALGLATSGSDPEAYGIEILPDAVRKRRDFMGGPAFLIAAAVLALIYLGVLGWRLKGQLDVVARDASRQRSEHRRAVSSDQETSSLLTENAELAQLSDELFTVAGSGEQMVRTLAAVERFLPDDFWIETLSSTWSHDEELGVERKLERPILRIKGKTREGTISPAVLFEDFVQGVQASLPEARLKHRMGDTGTHFTLDLTLLQPAQPEDSEDLEADADDEAQES